MQAAQFGHARAQFDVRPASRHVRGDRHSTQLARIRDDLRFLNGQIDLQTYGSRGQQRTAVLALKLAQVAWMVQTTGQRPILLLDDVMSEQAFAMSGAVEESSGPSAGHLKGARYQIMGEITEFSDNESGAAGAARFWLGNYRLAREVFGEPFGNLDVGAPADLVVIDAGTGMRPLGLSLCSPDNSAVTHRIHVLISHTHWDHIQGFPFFEPAYDPKRKITIAICGKDRGAKDLEKIFSSQMQLDFFPVPLDKMGATIKFWQPDIDHYKTSDGVKITASRHNHPGDAYGYRIEDGGKILVYCTDVEHNDGIDLNVVALSRNADLLIHDAHYTPEELKSRKGWGHSSYSQAIEVAERCNVKQLIITHHDPDHDDDFLNL